MIAYITALAVMLAFVAPWQTPTSQAATNEEIQAQIDAKQQQIQALQQEIQAYQTQADTAGAQSRTLQSEVAKLNAQIGQLNAEIRSLQASIDQTNLQIDQTTGQIKTAEEQITLHQQALAQSIQETDSIDHKPLALVLLEKGTLSDFFDYVHSVQRTQDTLRLTIDSINTLKGQLDQQNEDLNQHKQDLERLQGLQQIQQQEIATTKSTKNKLLVQTQGQESKFQQLVKNTTANLQALKQEITYLQQNGISVDDAVKYAQLAAIGAGIRPAFLLALLEVESRLGQNVGTGNWKDDMYLCYQRLAAYYPSKKAYYLQRAETEKNAYFKITGALGIDPDSQKVSKEPTYGCGGAMGPAQFIPSTWLGYEDAVTRITGNANPNPWSAEDAFTAAAVKLANAGATSQTRAGEVAAAKAYIGGSTTCSKAICNSYANTILQKAATIEQDL